MIIVFERWRVGSKHTGTTMNSLCGTVMRAFFPLTVIDMLPEMTLYESIVDRRQWETS